MILLSSSLIFSGVRVTRSLVLFVCFVDRCLSFCTFSFGHCVVCSSLIYRLWLPLWYLQTLLMFYMLPYISGLKCRLRVPEKYESRGADVSSCLMLNI
jgi:hypothetical protein